jgi:hypothetical protein
MGEPGMNSISNGRIHRFHESLALSLSKRFESIWECVYRNAFPQFISMTEFPTSWWHQERGIDREIQLENGKRILIDEKWRTKDYGDILLEYISNDVKQTPGWVVKKLQADYIAYAVGPAGVCYLLPVMQLQLAWQHKAEEWIELYGPRVARNETYNTISCPVPRDVLYAMIGKMFRPCFPRVSIEESQTFESGRA